MNPGNSGLIFVGCLFLGSGVGMLAGNISAGATIGLGIGLL